MRPADEEQLREILLQVLESVEPPPAPWLSIAKAVRTRRPSWPTFWSVRSAVVLVLFLAIGLLAHAALGPQYAIHKKVPRTPAPTGFCSVVFGITGIPIDAPLGTVSVVGKAGLPGTFATPLTLITGSGAGYEGPCGQRLVLTETPLDPLHSPFIGWRVTGAAALEIGTGLIRSQTLSFTLKGSSTVVYVKYLHIGPWPGFGVGRIGG